MQKGVGLDTHDTQDTPVPGPGGYHECTSALLRKMENGKRMFFTIGVEGGFRHLQLSGLRGWWVVCTVLCAVLVLALWEGLMENQDRTRTCIIHTYLTTYLTLLFALISHMPACRIMCGMLPISKVECRKRWEDHSRVVSRVVSVPCNHEN